MEVANASLYDGATSCAEAVMMANRLTRRKKALLSGNLHPHYAETAATYGRFVGFETVRAEPDPADSTAGVIFRWLNFLIVFGGIGYLIAKNGGAFFRANAKEIAASIVQASAAKEEANRELHAVEDKIAHLDQDVAELRQQARRNWEAESQRLYASGVTEIEKINQAARAELAASERAAQQQLRAIAASMAVENAAALVGARMNAEARAKIFQAFLADLGRSRN
jgi:F0F1-type ATP synthase membrane subunit b/b'